MKRKDGKHLIVTGGCIYFWTIYDGIIAVSLRIPITIRTKLISHRKNPTKIQKKEKTVETH